MWSPIVEGLNIESVDINQENNDAILESIAKIICQRVERCAVCPLSDDKICKGSSGITKDVIDMVQQWENEALESLKDK